MEEVIVAWNLTKEYDNILAVDHVSFEVNRGEVFGFLGPNGAGKTTTIKMLTGLTAPSEGTARVAGFDIMDDIVEVKRRVGLVPESSNLYDELTVWDNLLFTSQLYHVPRGKRGERIDELLETFNIQERRLTKFGKLSRGLKRRVVIAAALIHQPEILIMDEPTSGLDVVSARSLRLFIKELHTKETTVLLTTHYIEEADHLSDRIAIMVKGKIRTVDTPEKIKQSVRGTPVTEARLSGGPDTLMIHELEDMGKVECMGHMVRVETEDVQEAIEALIRLSSQRGIRIEEVNTLRPSLEDAFVELTGVSTEAMSAEKENRRR